MKNISLKSNKFNGKGFAMLFTVLIVTLILSIAIGISTLSLKQTILSSLAKDSQISFYEADTAVECGLYYDTVTGAFPVGTDGSTAPSTITCGNKDFSLDSSSTMDYLIYKQNAIGASSPCSSILFDKATTPGTNVIQGRGYNICSTSPRQVERALEVLY
jgi:hypothetical protein